jgi:hypothetical protein
MRALVLLAALFAASAGFAAQMPRELIAAMLKSPWPVYPAVPSLPEQMRAEMASEIASSEVVRKAVEQLNPENQNTAWFAAIATLEKVRAIWSLQACLCHRSPDVQVKAIEALGHVRDSRAAHFIILYAEYMTVDVGGSESATIHGILLHSIAQTMSAITGLPNTYNRDSNEN